MEDKKYTVKFVVRTFRNIEAKDMQEAEIRAKNEYQHEKGRVLDIGKLSITVQPEVHCKDCDKWYGFDDIDPCDIPF